MTNFTHTISAAVAALIVSSLFITAAVGPGQSVETSPVTSAQVSASVQAHA